MARSWSEKHDKHPHPVRIETLAKPFAGRPAGATLVIARPEDMTAFFRSVPRGESRSMEDLRAHLAKTHGADAACPLTTGIFSRIAAELAYEHHLMGADAAPFWRVIDPDSPLAGKLSCGAAFIRAQRAAEGIVEAPPAKKRARRPGA